MEDRILSVEEINASDLKWKACKCPFCFKPTTPFKQMAFRAETSFTESELDDIINPEEYNNKAPYVEKVDEVLQDHLSRYPREGGFDDEDESITHAVLGAPGSVGAHIMNVHYIIDDDGYPCGMIDHFGAPTYRRICPYCHNNLPHEFGKYPTKYIAVVGITSSGKTVYLAQLMSTIEEYLQRVNLVPVGLREEMEDYVAKHQIRRNKSLPFGNTAHQMTLPIPITVRNKETGKKCTLIFFDIAGENCVRPDQMQKYGPFIVNSHGIILIVDPKQFTHFFDLDDDDDDDDDMDIAKPEKVINAMYNAFLAASSGANGKSMVPFAACISKSDLLRPFFARKHRDSNILHPINYAMYYNVCGGDKRGIGFEDCRNVSLEMRDLYRGDGTSLQGNVFLDSIDSCFANSALFAFSSLGIQPTKSMDDDGNLVFVPGENPEPLRIEEPLFWLLYQFGLVGALHRNGTYDPPLRDFEIYPNGGPTFDHYGQSYDPRPKEKKKGLFGRK